MEQFFTHNTPTLVILSCSLTLIRSVQEPFEISIIIDHAASARYARPISLGREEQQSPPSSG